MPHYPSGVPNPYTAHIHPYPTRFHGGIWVRPTFGLPYVRQPLNIIRPSQRGVGNWDTGTGVFRRPAADGGGLFNQISGLGEMSAQAKTFIGAGVLSFGLVFFLFRKKKTMTANARRQSSSSLIPLAARAAARRRANVVTAFNEDFHSGKLSGLGVSADAAWGRYSRAYEAERKKMKPNSSCSCHRPNRRRRRR